MALRACSNNPLGGFASTPSSSLPQTIKELVENSIDASSSSIAVVISRASATTSTLTVLDSGCGIDDLPRLLQAFSSSKASDLSSTTSGRFGIGLTLSILHAFLATGTPATIVTRTLLSPTPRCYTITPRPDDDTVDCVLAASPARPSPVGNPAGTLVTLTLPTPTPLALASALEYTSRFHLITSASTFTLSLCASPSVVLHIAPPSTLPLGMNLYLGKPIPTTHIACTLAAAAPLDRHSLHRNTRTRAPLSTHVPLDRPFSVPQTATLKSGLQTSADQAVTVEVCVAVDNGGDEEEGDSASDSASDGDSDGDSDGKSVKSSATSASSSSSSSSTASNATARLHLVRIVNNAPMLDSPETPACALVTLLPTLPCWRHFGLSLAAAPAIANLPPHMPAFTIRDALPVAAHGTHQPGRTATSSYLPVGVRLRNVFVVIRVRAAAGAFPLPTLSKSRLPEGDWRIEEAVEEAM